MFGMGTGGSSSLKSPERVWRKMKDDGRTMNVVVTRALQLSKIKLHIKG